MSKLTKLLLLISCLLIFGCDQSKPADTSGTPTEDPAEVAAEVNAEVDAGSDSYLGVIEVGNQYQYLMMMSEGGMQPMRYTTTYRIVGMKDIKGKSYYEVHVDTGGYPMLDNFVEYDRVGEDGYYMIAHDDETQTEFMTFPRPIPTEVGATWQVERPGKEPEPCTILGYETLTLFGTTYEDCLKIRRESEHCVITGWLAKGIGSVKFVQDYGHGVLVFLRKAEPDQEKTADGVTPPAVED